MICQSQEIRHRLDNYIEQNDQASINPYFSETVFESYDRVPDCLDNILAISNAKLSFYERHYNLKPNVWNKDHSSNIALDINIVSIWIKNFGGAYEEQIHPFI